MSEDLSGGNGTNTVPSASGQGRRAAAVRRVAAWATGTGLVVMVFALLLWARLLLVTGHPRTAIAVPEAGTAAAVGAERGGDDGRAESDGWERGRSAAVGVD